MNNFESTGSPDQTIPAGAEAPSTIVYELTTNDPNIDFTQVSTAVFRVRHGNGEVEDMFADVEPGSLTPTFIKLSRQLQADDFPEPDIVVFFPLLTFNLGQDIAGPARTMEVVSRFLFRGET